MSANMRRAAGPAQLARKRNVIVAGLGAAFVASLLTIHNGAEQTSAGGHAGSAGGRGREKLPEGFAGLAGLIPCAGRRYGTAPGRGGYVSPPVKLTTQPQAVVLPKMRGDVAFEEPIVVQGDAQAVVMENLTHNFRRVYQLNDGTATIMTTWVPLTTCQIGIAMIPAAEPQ